MSGENEELTASDSIRSFISKHFDENVDLKVQSNRTGMIKKFKENNPNMKASTIDAIFSREIPKVGKAYNFEKEELKKKTPTKFDKSKLGVKITKQPSNVKTVGIKNPELNPNEKQSMFENELKKYKYEIKDTQITAFCDSVYGLFQLMAKDLDDLTEQESNDLGDLWQPIAQDKLGNSQKGQAALAVGGTSGIILKKVKKAKEKRKIRLEKESKEKKPEKTPVDKITDKVSSPEKVD